MSYWHEIFPTDRILDVEYEDLVDQPEENIRRILDHCNLSWD